MPALRPEALEDRTVPSARLQVINDVPPIVGVRPSVDVYVDGSKVASNLAPGQGTPFVTVRSDIQVRIDVVPAGVPGTGSAYGTLTATFHDNTASIAVADRTAGPIDLTLLAEESAAGTSNVDVLIFNGVQGLDRVDVRVRGTGTVANNLVAGSSTNQYLSLPPAVYTVDVYRADGAMRVGSIPLDLSSGSAGKAAVLALGGSLIPVSSQSPGALDASFVYGDGTTKFLNAASSPPTPTYAAAAGGTAGLFSQTGQSAEQRAVGGTAGTAVVAADVNGDGVAELVTAGPAGAPSVVQIGSADRIVHPFEDTFTGGVFLAAGDFNGDGYDDIVVTPDQGGGGRVRIFDGKTLETMADFFGIDDPNFRGGARAAVADVNGDGVPDLIVAAGFGGGPRVAIFDGRGIAPGSTPPKLVGDFFVFENTLRNGVFVAAGDVNGDGFADPVFGGGPGGGPRVLALDGGNLTANGVKSVIADFFAGDPNGRDGVRVASHYVDDDRKADVIAGLGTGSDKQVRVFLGANLPLGGTPAADAEYGPFPGATGAVFVG